MKAIIIGNKKMERKGVKKERKKGVKYNIDLFSMIVNYLSAGSAFFNFPIIQGMLPEHFNPLSKKQI